MAEGQALQQDDLLNPWNRWGIQDPADVDIIPSSLIAIVSGFSYPNQEENEEDGIQSGVVYESGLDGQVFLTNVYINILEGRIYTRTYRRDPKNPSPSTRQYFQRNLDGTFNYTFGTVETNATGQEQFLPIEAIRFDQDGKMLYPVYGYILRTIPQEDGGRGQNEHLSQEDFQLRFPNIVFEKTQSVVLLPDDENGNQVYLYRQTIDAEGRININFRDLFDDGLLIRVRNAILGGIDNPENLPYAFAQLIGNGKEQTATFDELVAFIKRTKHPILAIVAEDDDTVTLRMNLQQRYETRTERYDNSSVGPKITTYKLNRRGEIISFSEIFSGEKPGDVWRCVTTLEKDPSGHVIKWNKIVLAG